ncbi:hypothetical protein SLS53_002138 [Cytospora paraplurivora]|uniref:Uncharacterized protein n=1 Tax=Cytospora paraplurivora TaxID=2898453 RepID=A0AAN9UI87_9PEZI
MLQKQEHKNNSTDTGGSTGGSPQARPSPEAGGAAAAAGGEGGIDGIGNGGEVDLGAGAGAARALPAPGGGGGGDSGNNDDDGSAVQTLQVDGKPLVLDQLGPMVVHKDGTLSRIANWPEMTEIERRNTVRILVKRNQVRLGALREGLPKEGGEGETKASS